MNKLFVVFVLFLICDPLFAQQQQQPQQQEEGGANFKISNQRNTCDSQLHSAFEELFKINKPSHWFSEKFYLPPQNASSYLSTTRSICGDERFKGLESYISGFSPNYKNLILGSHSKEELAVFAEIVTTGLLGRKNAAKDILRKFLDYQLSSEKKSSHPIDEVVNLQLPVPFFRFLSPKLWWVKADPIRDNGYCQSIHMVSYITSWVASMYFISMALTVLEKRGDLEAATRSISFAGFAAFVISLVYALIVKVCAKPNLNCDQNTRIYFNFIWSPILFFFYQFLSSFTVPTVNSKTDAFVYNLKKSRQPVISWLDGHIRVHGGRAPGTVPLEESLKTISPPSPPSTWENSPLGLKLSTGLLTGVLFGWLFAC
eukprot:c17471_g1_i1.p1 GENE.c17471_g1_i1~~c17471_g1_i1.p1  ORF type:complete len:372 (+),score=105.89 c17471_g1_i1:38-1153(+)